MGRILAIDFGDKRIGLAISDELGLTAQGLSTFQAIKNKSFILYLKGIIDEKKIEEIVIGLPKMMDGTLGEKAKQVQKLAEDIKGKFGISVALWDERLSSVQSEKILREMGEKYTREKQKIDQLSAILILQNYLDYKRNVHE
jgi:putative Holliday junction resolvase